MKNEEIPFGYFHEMDTNHQLKLAQDEERRSKAKFCIAQAVYDLYNAANESPDPELKFGEIKKMSQSLKDLLSNNVDQLGEDFVIEFGQHIEQIVSYAEQRHEKGEM